MRASRRLPLEALAPYLLDVPHPRFLRPDSPSLALGPPIDWRALFGNEHPVEIEVGFGKGLFLLTQGEARPATNFLGIEIERKYTLLTATRIAQRALQNVKVVCTEARWFLKERVAAASVAAIHVYFPDPWWKTRHRKRKLFTRDFAEGCARVLQAGGRLHFATDVADYYAETVEMLKEVPALRLLPTPAVDENSLTNFERKYRQEGRPIYRALYENARFRFSAGLGVSPARCRATPAPRTCRRWEREDRGISDALRRSTSERVPQKRQCRLRRHRPALGTVATRDSPTPSARNARRDGGRH